VTVDRPSLADLGGLDWAHDPVAELVYQTLCDRGLEPETAAKKVLAHYSYDPFGRMVDDIEDAPLEDWQEA
jgi:hypothetical protein